MAQLRRDNPSNRITENVPINDNVRTGNLVVIRIDEKCFIPKESARGFIYAITIFDPDENRRQGLDEY